MPLPLRARCAVFALACTLCVFIWQALTVRYTYAGNWTGLFCTGALYAAPPSIPGETLFMFQDKFGYDGQAYHYIAHDPFFRRGFDRSIDVPRLRYRRILVPGLAWLLAAGNDRGIDFAYMAVVLGFILLGAYWLGRFGVLAGYGAWLGLVFVFVPAVVVSIDRLTVDVALAACCVGFALYFREWTPWKLWLVLAAAALTRETGLLLIAACILWLLMQRRFRPALLFITAVLPTACWYIFVNLHTAPKEMQFFLTPIPLSGLLGRALHPALIVGSPAVGLLANTLDLLALAGVAGALVWAFLKAFRRVLTPVTLAIYLFALLAIFLTPGDLWSDSYSFGRTLTPLLLLSALDGLAEGNRWPAFAMLLVDPRMALQMGGQILNVFRGLMRL